MEDKKYTIYDRRNDNITTGISATSPLKAVRQIYPYAQRVTQGGDIVAYECTGYVKAYCYKENKMEEKIMTINELMDRINEAKALAFQQHIKANAIIINENFVSVPAKLVGNAEYPPMICGLEMHFTKAELPDNAMFAVCEVRETARQKAIRLAKEEVIQKVKKYIDELFDKVDDLTQE